MARYATPLQLQVILAGVSELDLGPVIPCILLPSLDHHLLKENIIHHTVTMSGLLKRKFEEVDEDPATRLHHPPLSPPPAQPGTQRGKAATQTPWIPLPATPAPQQPISTVSLPPTFLHPQ
ncbi:hypothetical protein WMY93_030222 [Mugilogobius chulae]|uniref:Uncharacterized protein n=1 Tax=Mugilogobius chulae TaxID=88201 RepID=A0AAW0MTW4_9GOBI